MQLRYCYADMVDEAADQARLARDLAKAAPQVPRAAHHAQVAMGWAAVLEKKASSASCSPFEFHAARVRCRSALCRTLAEIMADWLGPAVVAMSARKTPPPVHFLLSGYPPELVTRITPDLWSEAWSILRGKL